MSEIKKITLPEELRVRLDWFDGPEIFGVRAEKALLVSLDFTKPMTTETRELFGADGDLFDFYTGQGRASSALHEHFPWSAPRMTPPRTARFDGFDPKNHFPFDLIFVEPEKELPQVPYSSTITHDSALGCFVRERYDSDWGAFQAALRRIGLAGGIDYRQCESCERPVRSSDPAIRFCRHCVPRPPDPEEPSCCDLWKERKFRAELPPWHSLAEVEKAIRKTKLVWLLHCNGEQLDSPDFATDAIGWFFYEGLYGCFEADFFLAGAALTTAEILVKQHGFSWRLENGIAFISHPAVDSPVKVGDILADYGFQPPEVDKYGNTSGDEQYEYDPGVDDLCRSAIEVLSRAVWPPLNVAEACRHAEANNCGDVKKALKFLRKTGPEGLTVDYGMLTFSFRSPEKSKRFETEYSGNFQYRGGHWVAVVDGAAIEEEDSVDAGPPVIITAAEAGDIAVLRGLLDVEPKLLHWHGGDFDLGTFSVDTPLAAAAANGHVEAVRFLLERGARPFKKPYHPCSALLRACANGHLEVVELLLAHGVPAEPPPNTQRKLDDIQEDETVSPKRLLAMVREEFLDDAPTPLEEAAKHNHPAIVKLLLAHGADPFHAQAISGMIPFHWSYHFPEVMEVFLDAGVPIDVRDKFGKTALHQAAIFGTMLDSLRKQGMSEDDEFMVEPKRYRKAVERLIERGADINARDDRGETPFHLACHDGSREYLQYFLDHGADPDIRTDEGKIPLDYAEERNNCDGIELLMAK